MPTKGLIRCPQSETNSQCRQPRAGIHRSESRKKARLSLRWRNMSKPWWFAWKTLPFLILIDLSSPLLPSLFAWSDIALSLTIVVPCCCCSTFGFISIVLLLLFALSFLSSVNNGPVFCIEYYTLAKGNVENTRSGDRQWASNRTKSPSWSRDITEEEAQASDEPIWKFWSAMVGSSNPSIGHLFWCICGFSRLLIR